MPVVIRCTVCDGDGEELFQLEGGDMVAVAFLVSQRVFEEWRPSDAEKLTWKFEKIYPEREEHRPPPEETLLKSWDNYVATMQRQLETL